MTLAIPEQFNLTEHFLERQALAHPKRLAIAGEPAPVTYGELLALTNRVGHALLRSGVQRGQRVLIALPDSAEFMAAFFGAAKIGAVAVPVNPLSRGADFAYYAADCGAALAVVHASCVQEFLSAREFGVPETVVILGEAPGGLNLESWANWADWIAERPDTLEGAQTQSTDPAFFLYTSGSTGGPKAAVHQHKDVLVTSESFAKTVLQISESDRCFSVSKLFFAYGMGNGLYFPLGAGASVVLNPERPRPDRVLDLVEKHRPTLFFAVPTFYAALLREAQNHAVDFSSVRMCISAGEALPAELFEQFRRRFGLEIVDAIGSTEMLHMFISSVPGKIRAGSCGEPLPGYEAKIVDEEGGAVDEGVIGNLWVRGASAFAEYWNKPEKTALAKRADGWVITGDKFHRDADGYYFYDGRADDMLKVSGLWVSPAEVENALLAHPLVAEAAVVGRVVNGLTRMVAHVVVREGARGDAETAESIREAVRNRLVAYKCPQEIVFVSELPKTATGKIQRFKLRG